MSHDEKKLAIVGSRHYKNYEQFEKRVLKWMKDHGKPTKIISGGATGADAMAERFSKENGIECQVFLPDWSKGGGPARNTLIVNACTHVLAFPSKTGKGTQNTIKQANAKNKHIEYDFV